MVLLALFDISFASEMFQLRKARMLKEEPQTKLKEEPKTKPGKMIKESPITAHMTSFNESEHSA
jgi:hypothetical protein